MEIWIKSIKSFTIYIYRPTTRFVLGTADPENMDLANVNRMPHPRWSQASERLLGSGDRVPTQIYNGYGSEVAALYGGMYPADKRALFY